MNVIEGLTVLLLISFVAWVFYWLGHRDGATAEREKDLDKRLDMIDATVLRSEVGQCASRLFALGRALGWEYLEAQHHVPGGRRLSGWYPKEVKCGDANARGAATKFASTGDVLTVLHTSSPQTGTLVAGGFSQYGVTVSRDVVTPSPKSRKRKPARGSSKARGRK